MSPRVGLSLELLQLELNLRRDSSRLLVVGFELKAESPDCGDLCSFESRATGDRGDIGDTGDRGDTGLGLNTSAFLLFVLTEFTSSETD